MPAFVGFSVYNVQHIEIITTYTASQHVAVCTFSPLYAALLCINILLYMSVLPADIRAECPALMLAFLSLALPQAECVYREEDGRSCVCLFDWLTLLTSLMWTIKSVAVLRHEGYDGWSFTSSSHSQPRPSKKKKRKKRKLQMLCFSFFSSLILFIPSPISFATLPELRKDSEGE